MISASCTGSVEVRFPWCESAAFLPGVSELCWVSVASAVPCPTLVVINCAGDARFGWTTQRLWVSGRLGTASAAHPWERRGAERFLGHPSYQEFFYQWV